MRKVSPSVLVREELDRLLRGGVGEGENIVSALVDTVSRLVLQELLEAEQADYLGGRGRYERRAAEQRGLRNGYESGRLRTAEGAISVRVPQVRGAEGPHRSGLMSFLDGWFLPDLRLCQGLRLVGTEPPRHSLPEVSPILDGQRGGALSGVLRALRHRRHGPAPLGGSGL
jgi:hypothetical protein